ncbi:hypothetical protein NPIL_656871 [Nephila pilipes]|uniref:Uncharacterized protein n=1 Tax=Nephila pilipes TaxID=299642 RepID=A0A8X6IIP7_NEPPI|nr:hypothetical protein NPIL_656871 [Nephila pilipes]
MSNTDFADPFNMIMDPYAQDLYSPLREFVIIAETNKQSLILYQYAGDHNYSSQAPNQPTKINVIAANSIIDLCLSKKLHNIYVESIQELSSDHNPIIFKVGILDCSSLARDIIQLDNWNLFQSHLFNFILRNPKVTNIPEIEKAIENLNTHISTSTSTSSKPKVFQYFHVQSHPPYYKKKEKKRTKSGKIGKKPRTLTSKRC